MFENVVEWWQCKKQQKKVDTSSKLNDVKLNKKKIRLGFYDCFLEQNFAFLTTMFKKYWQTMANTWIKNGKNQHIIKFDISDYYA